MNLGAHFLEIGGTLPLNKSSNGDGGTRPPIIYEHTTSNKSSKGDGAQILTECRKRNSPIRPSMEMEGDGGKNPNN